MIRDRLVVFYYKGHLAYATEREYNDRLDYMFVILPDYRDFDEVKDYLETVCNYDNYIIDKTDEEY